MHKLECSAMCSFGENWCPSETIRLAARVITRMKVQKERSASEKLLLLKDLEANMNEADIAELHHFYSKQLDFPDHQALLTLFAQVHCNGFTVEDEELSHIGSAVFPDVALMNHKLLPQRYRHLQRDHGRGASCERYQLRRRAPPSELLEICELSMDKMGSTFGDSNVYMLHMMQLYPAYSLNVASMYLKLGRLYVALDRASTGSTALKKALAIMEVVHGKDHNYVKELQKEISTHQK
ncbi:N-lysine methyltransferase SMYD2-B [Bagarius yarrelli]|uniref:N-lysine methyltransferase SMYD2-B n=1 Tax=Bagarius yarrelli TaxID=175774 RepID=A0A556TZB4_BAGYA|nr:N-lysine methyltransferase SMYD2-B [Bagarius yarrelli]